MIHCHCGAWSGPTQQIRSNMCRGDELRGGGQPVGGGHVGHTVAWSLDLRPDVDTSSSLRLIVDMTAPFSL